MNPAILQFLNVVRSAWRFRWAGLASAWAVALLGWAVVLLIPGKYQTEARVYVDTSTLLRPLLEGLTVAPNTNNQVDLVRQAIMARPQLERVIDSTGLRDRVSTAAQREGLVLSLGQDILIRNDGQSRNYSIMYRDSDPKVSYEVVKALLGAFVGGSQEANREDSESARRFLEQQLREIESRLVESENKLADFKRKNIGSMPDDRGGYFERTQAEMTELDRLAASLSVATNRRDQLRQRLLGGGSGQSGSASASSSVDGRLSDARARLDTMLLNVTEAHPDAIALQETIAALERQRAAELESFRQNVDALGSPRAATNSLVTQNLQIALNEVEVEIASIRAQMADRQQRVAQLRGAINVLPQVEAELARLNRDYGINRTQYDALLQRLESARLSQEAQKSQSVLFNVINPPMLPLTPATPNRTILGIGVLLAALAAGAGVAYMLSVARPVFLNGDDVRTKISGLPVIGSVGIISNPMAQRRARYELAGYSVLGCCLLVALMAVLIGYQRWDSMKSLAVAGGLS